ncbi:urease accessory protein UreF [Hymenobacter chitinivorans]|uniref:Urease accessory protein UreF n=1 Tax=Hymenobacter chitinivorans DSM 11115 TaxID=1121954 RepID=A0A2M9BAB8_9BACT|nr:urease accessory UreF family protein [Hymenobacter chitinivorans]PJJ54892.1 urease accessory protein [Hymenobacter chitinivorans DSM 11115]
MSQFARLLHLVDSSIPTGAFAYSYGLESSITFGLIRTQSELRNFLYSHLQQVGSLELPFMHACFQRGISPELAPVAQEYEALLLVPALHKASVVQGRNWLKLLVSFYPEANLTSISNWFMQHELPPHFTLVFALGLQQVGFALDQVQTMFLHMLLRDQLSAAIRLGFLGPMEGHQLQHDFYAVFEHILASQAGKTYAEATRSAFVLDAAQVLHDDIYSKLFQN